jgi:thioredoxin reductase (NADPH)
MSLFKPIEKLEEDKVHLEQEETKSWTDKDAERVRCLIIGSGPAGFTAAIYAARANINPVLYEGLQPGGQLTTTTEVENFPGYPEGVTGPVMMEDFKKQALRFGADIRWGVINNADLSSYPFRIQTDEGNKLLADSLIIATGATAKYLGLEN